MQLNLKIFNIFSEDSIWKQWKIAQNINIEFVCIKSKQEITDK